MKLIFPVIVLLTCASAFGVIKTVKPEKNSKAAATATINAEKKEWHISATNDVLEVNLRLRTYAANLKPYLAAHGFNTGICFLADMKIESGRKRFFVYDLKGDSVLRSGMVTHGSGSQTEAGPLVFSNKANSLATSLGKYKIGEEYSGKFGLAFKLYGLDKTNSNAYARAVVLHGHPYVPAAETAPRPVCLSWGCPTVNPEFLKVLKKYINDSEKPVMLEICY